LIGELKSNDPDFQSRCDVAVKKDTVRCHNSRFRDAISCTSDLPQDAQEVPWCYALDKVPATKLNALKANTERLPWHQCLGHPSDECLYEDCPCTKFESFQVNLLKKKKTITDIKFLQEDQVKDDPLTWNCLYTNKYKNSE